jgi:hypothetical protein
MTRDDILSVYRPLRASIQSVLKAATATCNTSDWRRAAKLLCFDLEDSDEDGLLAEAQHTEMLMDVALFEPNQSGKRTYDRFLKAAGRKLAPAELEVARALQGAYFSVFRIQSRHETAGLWLEDLLNDGPPIWIVDEGMEASGPDGLCFAARVFNAGGFHAGLGIILPLDAESVADYQALAEDPEAEVARGAFAVLAYREAILGNVLKILNRAMADMSQDDLDQLSELMLDLDVDLPGVLELEADQPSLPALPAPRQRKRA